MSALLRVIRDICSSCPAMCRLTGFVGWVCGWMLGTLELLGVGRPSRAPRARISLFRE